MTATLLEEKLVRAISEIVRQALSELDPPQSLETLNEQSRGKVLPSIEREARIKAEYIFEYLEATTNRRIDELIARVVDLETRIEELGSIPEGTGTP